MVLVNIWHLRRVAEASAKSCDICYRLTTSVLITPDNKDHFYICQGHLKDHSFCSPVVDEDDVAAKKKKEDLDREIELIKKEYEERLKLKKKNKEKKKDENKKREDADKEKEKDEEKKDDEDYKAEKEKDAKIKAIANQDNSRPVDGMPRIYRLQKVFYEKRQHRIRKAEIATRNRERLKSPTLFPSVPTGSLG